MVVGTGLPDIGSGIALSTSTSRPSTFTLIFSIGGIAGLVESTDICESSISPIDPSEYSICYELTASLIPSFLSAGHAFTDFLILRSFLHKLVLELRPKTLPRPRGVLAEAEDRPASGIIVSDFDEVIRVVLPALAMCQPMKRLCHP